MKKKHYHVLGGLRGYMPSINYVCETKKQAEAILSDCKKQEIDASYQMVDRSNFSITGSMRQGYYIVSSGGNEYYEIVECQESDCLIREDYG